jgi:hypothetical protein
MEGLVRHGLLRARTEAYTYEWLLSDGHDVPVPPDRYVVSFAHFHERRLASPPHRFL